MTINLPKLDFKYVITQYNKAVDITINLPKLDFKFFCLCD